MDLIKKLLRCFPQTAISAQVSALHITYYSMKQYRSGAMWAVFHWIGYEHKLHNVYFLISAGKLVITWLIFFFFKHQGIPSTHRDARLDVHIHMASILFSISIDFVA
jgi:hypothetical protein